MQHYTENEIAKVVLDEAIAIHRKYGPGLLESFYEKVLHARLRKRGLHAIRQQAIKVYDEDLGAEEVAFRADLLVEAKVILELKSAKQLQLEDRKQLWTYLRLCDVKLGLLLNFGATLMKDGIVRMVNGLEE